MKWLLTATIILFAGQCWGAAFTSKAAGNWSASGQTTWNEVGVPGNGDTVTITHAVIVDVNTTIGASGALNSVACAVGAPGSLTVATGATLTLRGDLTTNNVNFTMQAGSGLLFDSSLSATPTTIGYKADLGTANPATSGDITFAGTSGSHVTVSSVTTNGALYGYVKTSSTGQGHVSIRYTDFSKLGVAGTDAILFRHGSTKNLTFEYNTITECKSQLLLYSNNANGVVNINNNYIYKNPIRVTATINISPSTTRNFTYNWVQGQLVFQSNSGLSAWNISNNYIEFLNSLSPVASQAFSSVSNNLFVENYGSTSQFNFHVNFGTLTSNYVIFHNPTAAHTEAALSGAYINVDGLVAENTHNSNSNMSLTYYSRAAGDPPATPTAVTFQNILIAQSAAGYASCNLAQLKGNKNLRISFLNNTVPISQTSTIRGIFSSSGSNSRGWPGLIAAVKNNLFYTPGTPIALADYGVEDQLSQSVYTGTVTTLSGDSLTLTLGTTFLTGNSSQEGFRVKFGSQIRTVTANTSNTVTIDSIFEPNLTAGVSQVTVYPIDVVTAADYNAFSNFLADGTLYDGTYTAVTTSKKGYDSLILTDPTLIGVHDTSLDTVEFRDTTRSIATFATAYLGNSANTAWNTSTAYVVGDGVSRAVSGFYGNTTLNYRAIHPHTSSAATAPGGFVNAAVNISATTAATPVSVTTSAAHNLTTGDRVLLNGASVSTVNAWWTVTVVDGTHFTLDGSTAGSAGGSGGQVWHNWRGYWEFEGMTEIRKTDLGLAGNMPTATKTNLYTWVREGYAPTTMALLTAGEGGTYIGAVQPAAATVPSKGGSNFNKFNLGFTF